MIFLNFWTNLTQKGYFRFKKEKAENYLQILHILISPNFSSNYFDFLKQISQKRIFRLNRENMNNTIEFSSTKFQLKLAILIFRTKLTQKGYLQSEREKMNKMHIPISQGNKFYFKQTINFRIKFAQKAYFRLKTEKSEHHQ